MDQKTYDTYTELHNYWVETQDLSILLGDAVRVMQTQDEIIRDLNKIIDQLENNNQT